MMWKTFVFSPQEPPVESLEADEAVWLEALLNGVRAEQVHSVGNHIYILYFPANYRDDFDNFGNEIL